MNEKNSKLDSVVFNKLSTWAIFKIVSFYFILIFTPFHLITISIFKETKSFFTALKFFYTQNLDQTPKSISDRKQHAIENKLH